MKVKIDIFSGFLGAGKTTLIKKLIESGRYRENIAIVENEFGAVGIDGKILEKDNVAVKEINSGCICCSVVGDFKEAILNVIENYKPKRIIIEPSGVAKLSEIINACKGGALSEKTSLNMIMVVVDSLKFDTYISNFSEFYRNQIVNAKTIVLSKTQNLDEVKLEELVKKIRKLNSKASIISTPWNHLKVEGIISVAEGNIKEDLDTKVDLLKKSNRLKSMKSVNKCHLASDTFKTWSAETPKKFNIVELEAKIKQLINEDKYGTVLRAKGIVQATEGKWIQFDYVPGEYAHSSIAAEPIGRLCVIGKDLNEHNLTKLFSV